MEVTRRRFAELASGVFAASVLPARAADYPSRPVRIIVPFGPGSQTDLSARVIAQKLSEELGQQFFLENLPGAGGTIGMGKAAQAAPDGYTLLISDATSYVVNPVLSASTPYEPFRDFSTIMLAASTTQVLAVHPSMNVRSVAELVTLLRANPGKYSYASSGFGTPSHLTAELFRTSLGLDLMHVPFGGAGPAINSTLGGHTPIAFGSPPSLVPHVKEGTLFGLAVAAPKRLAVIPEVPTMAEAGFADIE